MATKKSNVSSKKANKYLYVKVLQGNYGYGWEDLVIYDEDTPYSERKEDMKAYRENERGVPLRFINRRILNY